MSQSGVLLKPELASSQVARYLANDGLEIYMGNAFKKCKYFCKFFLNMKGT